MKTAYGTMLFLNLGCVVANALCNNWGFAVVSGMAAMLMVWCLVTS